MISAALDRNQVAGCRSLNIANIDPRVDERMLRQILSHAGTVVSLRIAPDLKMQYGGLATGHVEYDSYTGADTAMTTLNGQQVYDYCISFSWATTSTQTKSIREDTSSHFHLWIGDVAADVDDSQLHQTFSALGPVSDARVMWDPNTGKPRGYGFVSFREKADAERAITQMNGLQLGSKNIRVNWANQRNATSASAGANAGGGTGSTGGMVSASSFPASSGTYSSTAAFIAPTRPSLNYNFVSKQTSQMHTTIYIGNVPAGVTIDMLQPVFAPYGFVLDVKVNPERGFAFVKMDSHENAATAICWVNGVVLNGSKLKCAWGKDRAADSISAQAGYGASVPATPPHQQQPQQQHQQYYGYGYQGYPAGYEQYYNQYYAQYYQQQQQQQPQDAAAQALYQQQMQTYQQQQQQYQQYQQQDQPQQSTAVPESTGQ
eukprot:Partr_v1_DN25028_c0_g1_i1_m51037 putative Tia1 cytotoxic granule-associated RNA binding